MKVKVKFRIIEEKGEKRVVVTDVDAPTSDELSAKYFKVFPHLFLELHPSWGEKKCLYAFDVNGYFFSLCIGKSYDYQDFVKRMCFIVKCKLAHAKAVELNEIEI